MYKRQDQGFFAENPLVRQAFAHAFNRDLVWNDLAFQLPRFGRASIMAYLRLDHRRSWPKLRYLLSSFIKGRVYLPEVGEA